MRTNSAKLKDAHAVTASGSCSTSSDQEKRKTKKIYLSEKNANDKSTHVTLDNSASVPFVDATLRTWLGDSAGTLVLFRFNILARHVVRLFSRHAIVQLRLREAL